MQEILWFLRYRPPTAPIPDFFFYAELLSLRLYARRYAALARPKSSKTCPEIVPYLLSQGCFETTRPILGNPVNPRLSVQVARQNAIGRLGQLRGYHKDNTSADGKDDDGLYYHTGAGKPSNTSSIDDTVREIRYWERRLLKAQAKDGADGVWNLFKLLKRRRSSHILVHPQADSLRDKLVSSLIDNETQLAKLLDIAKELRKAEQFTWPHLYAKIIHSFLSRAEYSKALAWHGQLSPDFLPSADMFGVLLANLATRDDTDLQDTLARLYSLQIEHKLYDHIIPVLYGTGRSKQARVWRRRLLNSGDFPLTSKSLPFVRFLQRYYPNTPLAKEELLIAASAEAHQEHHNDPLVAEWPQTETYGDSLMAKWLATRWMPIDFAINFVLNLGLRTIGPRSLQSLALREPNAKGVAERIKVLEKRGMDISHQVYCKALVYFARSGDDKLLSSLLDCDIHPNEFDNLRTRQILMAASLRRGDAARAELLRGIGRAITPTAQPSTLNMLLEKELGQGREGSVKRVLRRMKQMNVSMGQTAAKMCLQHALKDIAWHPLRLGPNHSQLSTAIDTVRVVSRHDVAIPVWCWRKLLTNLGRTGRLDELEQLALEIVALYQRQYRELIPVHHGDLPRVPKSLASDTEPLLTSSSGSKLLDGIDPGDSADLEISEPYQLVDSGQPQPGPLSGVDNTHQQQSDATIRDEDLDTDENEFTPEYIPADLDFSHQEHPLFKLFDASLQRSIIRWGFDQMLAQRPRSPEAQVTSPDSTASFDVARGVRLLALLRDQGVYVPRAMVRAAVLARIVLNQVPGRRRDRARDSHEISTEAFKNLVDEAWGSELLPRMGELLHEVERQKLQTWSRYPKLFGRAFDDEYEDNHKEATNTLPIG
ncbi:hypothetical protein HJFPF1_07851 [Paramyrothecium foliicola]|nr:hypothetical protein HJFPF1_07851 [Paramyrothecium foliicola]